MEHRHALWRHPYRESCRRHRRFARHRRRHRRAPRPRRLRRHDQLRRKRRAGRGAGAQDQNVRRPRGGLQGRRQQTGRRAAPVRRDDRRLRRRRCAGQQRRRHVAGQHRRRRRCRVRPHDRHQPEGQLQHHARGGKADPPGRPHHQFLDQHRRHAAADLRGLCGDESGRRSDDGHPRQGAARPERDRQRHRARADGDRSVPHRQVAGARRSHGEDGAAGALGAPDDIAAAVSFLAGPDGGWINGQTIRANGGIV